MGRRQSKQGWRRRTENSTEDKGTCLDAASCQRFGRIADRAVVIGTTMPWQAVNLKLPGRIGLGGVRRTAPVLVGTVVSFMGRGRARCGRTKGRAYRSTHGKSGKDQDQDEGDGVPPQVTHASSIPPIRLRVLYRPEFPHFRRPEEPVTGSPFWFATHCR